MKIYDANKNHGPIILPLYYAGKMWGHNPDISELVEAGLIPYGEPVIDHVTQKLGDILISNDSVTHSVVDKTAEELMTIIPTTITKRQAIEYMWAKDIYHSTVTQIETLGEKAILIWGAVVEIDRNHDLVKALFTDEQLDVMFLEASEL